MNRASKIDRLAARYAEEERLRREDYPRYLAVQALERRAVAWRIGGIMAAAFLLGMALTGGLALVVPSRPHPGPCGPAARP